MIPNTHRPLVVAFSLVVLSASIAVSAEEHEYVGSQKCKSCHLKEWRSWATTKMANSLSVLKPGERAEAKQAAGLSPSKDYTYDETCLPCHSTGYGSPTGFVDEESTPYLVGVGCEMCHGAGGTYVKDDYMSLKNKSYNKAELVAVGLVDKVDEARCVGCHNADSPFVEAGFVFDFEAHKGEGTHEVFPLKYPH